MTDFLVTFTVDGRAAIEMMQQIGQQAADLEARLNALGQGTSGAAGGGVLGGLGLTPANLQQTNAQISALEAQLRNLRGATAADAQGAVVLTPEQAQQQLASIQSVESELTRLRTTRDSLATSAAANAGAGGVLGVSPAQVQATDAQINTLINSVQRYRTQAATLGQLNLSQSSAQLKSQAVATQSLANALGTTHPQYRQLSSEADLLNAKSKALQGTIQSSTGVFGTHVARIAEGILVYQGFAKAVGALSQGVGTIIDIDRESRRLQAVLGTTTAQTQQDIQQIGQVASQTVTPLADLVGVADQVSATFINLPAGAERSAASMKLLQDVGKITSVTQRDVATETDNLASILKQGGIDINNYADILGKIVVAGGNSSTVVGRLLDALQGSAQAARFFNVFKEGGAGIETLLGLESQFIIDTGRMGTSVGDTFKTMFAKITNPEADAAITKLTNGVVKLRDANGALRSPIDILVDLNAQVKAGIITGAQLNDVLSKIAPPLNPGAKSDLVLIDEELQRIAPRVAEIAQAGAGDLDKLVNEINSALGPQFQKLIIDAQTGINNLFGGPDGPVVNDGKLVIGIIRAVGTTLSSIPAPVLQTAVQLIALVTAFRLLLFVGKELGAAAGLGGLIQLFRNISVEMKTMQLANAGGAASLEALGTASVTTSAEVAGVGTSAKAVTVELAGVQASAAGAAGGVATLGDAEVATEVKTGLLATTATGAAAAFKVMGGAALALLGRLGPLLAIMAAIDAIQFAQDVGKQSADLDRQVGQLAQGGGVAQIQALRDKLQSQRDSLRPFFNGDFNPLDAIAGSFVTGPLQEKIDKLDKLMETLKARGAGATATFQELKDAGLDPTAAATDDTTKAITDQISALQKQIDAANSAAAAQAGLSQAERDTQVATQINNNLADDRVATLKKLDAELQKGKISQAEYAAQSDQLNKASDAASRLVAALGDKLKVIPQLAAAAAQGNDKLASALYQLILAGGKNVDSIISQINALVTFAEAHAAAADAINSNPIIIRTFIEAPVNRNATNMIGGVPEDAHGGGGTFRTSTGTTITTTTTANTAAVSAQTQITRELNQLLKGLSDSFTKAIATSGGSIGSTLGGAGTTRSTVPILDIGDLSPSQISKLVAIATALRNKLPGETAADKNDVVALIKNAQFLTTVRGIDDRLLQIALKELTDQMKTANDLAKQQQLQTLRNIQTQVGPLGALISQPTLFGVGGNIALGNGLNIDPNSGQVNINVAVDGKTLTDQQLAVAIANAIQAALRGG